MGQSTEEQKMIIANAKMVFPEPKKGSYDTLITYLNSERGISNETIQMLLDMKLMYQEEEHNNIVFINKRQDWGEISGVSSYHSDNSKQDYYHEIIPNSMEDGCWYFKTCEEPVAAFVCESAIEAISLYEIDRIVNHTFAAYYISIGSVDNQVAIDKIKKRIRTIIAVDINKSRSECRRLNRELESRMCEYQNWNETLFNIRRLYEEEGDIFA